MRLDSLPAQPHLEKRRARTRIRHVMFVFFQRCALIVIQMIRKQMPAPCALPLAARACATTCRLIVKLYKQAKSSAKINTHKGC